MEQLDRLKIELAETNNPLAEQEKQQLLIETCQEFGLSREDIVSKIMQKFSKERSDAEQVVNRY